MESNNIQDIWEAVYDQIKSYDEIDPLQISAFFNRLHPEAFTDGFLMLTAETKFIKTWIEKRYLTYIKQSLQDLFGMEYVVEIEVDEREEVAPALVQAAPVAPAQAPAITNPPAVAAPAVAQNPALVTQPVQAIHTTQPTQPVSVVPNTAVAANPADELMEQMGTQPIATPVTVMSAEPVTAPAPVIVEEKPVRPNVGLASSLTFETFVIGDSNRLAYSMAVSVAEMPGRANLNPLFIYGKSGLGKTHLLRAIQNYVLETNPSAKAIYIDSAEFLSEYASASAEHDKNKTSFQNFQNRYLNADVLLIDDVQYFTGKSATLDMVFQFFNKLTAMGKQVVLSADRAPKNIDIDERYKSRFNSGGTFDIQPPGVETKLGIIKSFIEEYKRTENCYDLYIPEDIQLYIAEVSSSNIRELKSAITKVIVQISIFNNSNIDLADVKPLLENHFSAGMSKRLNIEMIQKVVEGYYKINHNDLVGGKRSRNIIYARHIAMYLCRNMLDIPYNDIGKKFNRDHSTVMYSVTQVEDRLKTNRETQEEIEILTKLIREN